MHKDNNYKLYLMFASNIDGNYFNEKSELVLIGAFRKEENAKKFANIMNWECDEYNIKEENFQKDYFEYDGEIFEDNFKFVEENK